MRSLFIAAALLLSSGLFAQKDSARHVRRIHPLVFSSVSYQLAVNGGKADTDLGNFAFKGYVQPELGIGFRYQQDTMEFATVTASATRFVFTLASANIIYDSGNEYPITNRVDVYMNNYAFAANYHRRITRKNPSHYFSFECGAGLHVIQWYGTVRTDDTQVGPYAATHRVNTPKKFYALPSTQVGLNFSLVSKEHKTSFLIGAQSELYLAKFNTINYTATYESANNTLYYHLRWSPVIMVPKVYVMAMF